MSKVIRLPQVGDYVEVWWDGDERSYRGHLVKKRGRVHPFRFEFNYDDGDKQTHDLNEELWCFVDTPDKWYEPGEVEELKRELSERPFTLRRRLVVEASEERESKQISSSREGMEASERLKDLSEDALDGKRVAASGGQHVTTLHSSESKPFWHKQEMSHNSNLLRSRSSPYPEEVIGFELHDVNVHSTMPDDTQMPGLRILPGLPSEKTLPTYTPCAPPREVDNSAASTLDNVSEESNRRLECHLPQRKRLLARNYGKNNVAKE